MKTAALNVIFPHSSHPVLWWFLMPMHDLIRGWMLSWPQKCNSN